MKILRNARGKQTKNTASQGITINQLKPNKHVLANFPEASLCLAKRMVSQQRNIIPRLGSPLNVDACNDRNHIINVFDSNII